MKPPHNRKRKKRGYRKTYQADTEQNSAPKSVPEFKEAEKKKQKSSRKPDERRVIETKPNKNRQGFAFIDIAVQFLRDARIELRKVKWPTRKELLASTIMVLILVAAVAIYLGIIDIFLKMIMGKIIG